MTVTRNTIGALLAPGLKKVIFDDYLKVPERLLPLFNVDKSSRAYEEIVELTGVGPAEEKAEGVGIIYKDISQLTPKRIQMTTYALGMRCTMEAKQDELYGKLVKLASLIGKSFGVRREVERSNIFNGGFGTFFRTGQDGLALFSASHPLSGGLAFSPATTNLTALPARSVATGSNVLATAADLDYASIVDMTTLAMRTVDEQGDYIMMEPKRLIIASENWAVAHEMLRSQDKPTTANRAVSAINQLGLQVIQSPYLLDTDAWFMQSDDHDLDWFNRMPFTTDDMDDFDTGDTKIKGVERWGLGFASWRGVWGTTGA